MKPKDTKILIYTIIPAVAVVAGLVILLAGKKRKKNIRHKKEQIADEGYETAGDILFPLKKAYSKYRQQFN